jgi:hypothetical protein
MCCADSNCSVSRMQEAVQSGEHVSNIRINLRASGAPADAPVPAAPTGGAVVLMSSLFVTAPYTTTSAASI